MTSSIIVNLFVNVKLETTTNFTATSFKNYNKYIRSTNKFNNPRVHIFFLIFLFTFTNLNIKGFLVDKKIKNLFFSGI